MLCSNRKVPSSKPRRRMAGFRDSTSYEAPGDLWIEISMRNAVINIGMVRLLFHQLPKVGCGTAN